MLAFAVLSATALIGMLLAAWHLRATDGSLPPWWAGAIHGLCGAAGFAALLLALGGPARGVTQGAGSFGVVAAVMLGAALGVGGAVPLLWRWRGQPPGGVLAIHAVIAISGYVILAAYTLS